MPKRYLSGGALEVGDKVRTGDGVIGTIVAVIDDDQYSPEFAKVNWGHYETGVLVLSDEVGLVMYDGDDSPPTTFSQVG